ncbi:MAG TPA: DUF418 domain-containing protein [Lacunisphaera sp.]|nr:DUF418 domain-containing protein [Lacunisphaera sp.]
MTLDILRGFALLGMILAHVHKTMADGLAEHANHWVGVFITMGVAEKDRTIFAFLFGVGFAVLMRRLDAKGRPVVALFLRRLAGLYALGFAVETFTRFSILREYAWAGVPLLFLRDLPTRTLLILALLSVSALSLRDLIDSGYSLATRGQAATVALERQQLEQWDANKRAELALAASDDYGAVVATRFQRLIHTKPSLYHITPNIYLALFILGLLAIRHGVFDDPKKHVPLLATSMAVGVLIWMAAWWLLPLLPTEFASPRIALQCHFGLGIVDEQFLAFFFIGAITLWLAFRPGGQFAMMPLAWLGRMALTNYLIQVAVIDFASSRYGLGLRLPPLFELLAAAVLFALLVVLSRFWLSRFRFGPVEWLWRSLTYWKWQPIRIADGSPGLAVQGE